MNLNSCPIWSRLEDMFGKLAWLDSVKRFFSSNWIIKEKKTKNHVQLVGLVPLSVLTISIFNILRSQKSSVLGIIRSIQVQFLTSVQFLEVRSSINSQVHIQRCSRSKLTFSQFQFLSSVHFESSRTYWSCTKRPYDREEGGEVLGSFIFKFPGKRYELSENTME